MERDLDRAIASIIDRMLEQTGIARKVWHHDGPSGDLHFHTYARQGIDPTCVVRRKQIVGEGLDNPEMTHVRFEKVDGDYRLTPESQSNLEQLVRDGISQKRRHDAIIIRGGDPRTPPAWSVTMHRIGLILLSRNKGRRDIVQIDDKPALDVEDGPPPFPIVKGRVKDSPIHQQAIRDEDGRSLLTFRDRLTPGIFIARTILPETMIQSVTATMPDIAQVVAHPLFGEHVGVAVTDVAITSEGTHIFLQDVQDRLDPDPRN